ncbi:MAG: hypothetical protein ACREDI_07705, partial [Roseiarcus sp.]
PGLLVVKSGAVRVQLVSNAGRQITLYRVELDVACALSTQCLLGPIPPKASPKSAYPDFCCAAAMFCGSFGVVILTVVAGLAVPGVIKISYIRPGSARRRLRRK